MNLNEILDSIRENPYSALFYSPIYYDDSVSYFFKNPENIISAKNLDELTELFDMIEFYKNKGYTGYGYLQYETAYLLEEKLNIFKTDVKTQPLAKFCFFDKNNVIKIKSRDLNFINAKSNYQVSHPNYQNKIFYDNSIINFKLNTSKSKFIKDILKIKDYIIRGDTYQVNYTIKSKFDYKGDSGDLFKKLIFSQSARYSAFINNAGEYILSVSPELFFERTGARIICRPMKGTVKRGFNIPDDVKKKQYLESSDKNKSENVMIVDLLRNDISRIAKRGSVKVEELYKTEKYETLYQMTSDITAEVDKKIRIDEIFNKLFPCGSITGAPKIKTMEIIKEIENEPRGIYTGALGIVSKERDIFNIPIRTLVINKKSGKGEMGIGSGIVYDSDPDEEYKETILKSDFITKPEDYFYLFESMLIENNAVFLFKEHLERLKQAADFFMFPFNNTKVRIYIDKCIKNTEVNRKYKLKIILNKWGEVKTEFDKLDIINKDINIAVSKHKVYKKNKFQYFKTSNRDLYDSEFRNYRKKGIFEVIFFNEKGELAEGSMTNIFIRKNNKWYTPDITCGMLNGVYRKYFISIHPDCEETYLYKKDLFDADEIILTNSVRKEIKVNKLIQ
jgi:para-aminobenzoate synthetase / 4-amino-4-deoxychorismate lyase